MYFVDGLLLAVCTMRNSVSILAGLMAVVFLAAPAMAQDVCLQLNRVFSTKVINSDTLFATDLQHRPYTIHMRNRCVGLDQSSQNLSFRRATGIGSEYQCINRGDILGYSFPGDPAMGLNSITPRGVQTQMQCTIDSITPGPPPPAHP